MSNRMSKGRARLLCGAASVAIILSAGAAQAADGKSINIPPQSLASALHEFGVQSGHQVLFKPSAATSKTSPGASAEGDVDAALTQLLAGTGMSFSRAGDVFLIQPEGGSSPQSESAAGRGASTVEALIVTAQKREEDIQDVPIAISAFSQEDLTRSQVAGGPDLMTQVPNLTFTKTNFASYSIQIRGIGTQAISATTDPAVAVAFNNSAMIRNRFFEQEFYDLQRIEVLRGPQGTLYGRNATAGVVNLLTQKPRHYHEARLSADVANYSSTRLEGMLNIPLVEDRVALRLAGAWTKRQGYVTNDVTGRQIDGRDLWSTRLTLGFEPNDRVSAYFIWEHFEEDDDRLRSGKQLCKKAEFPETIGGHPVPTPNTGTGQSNSGALAVLPYLSQGCVPTSLYSPEAFQTPNGYALPYYGPLQTLSFPAQLGVDVYLRATQSQDLRVIESSYDPSYRARSDLGQLQFNIDLTDQLTLTSETLYATDWLFSTQDFNRFSTRPGAFRATGGVGGNPNFWAETGLLDENGVFCDPQLGCSDRLTLGDLSTAESTQFGQELRLSSDYEGPFNFSLGANFVRYDTEDRYYVFVNSLTLFAAMYGFTNDRGSFWEPGVSDNTHCLFNELPGDPLANHNVVDCIYIDPNPIGSLNGQGHNYFLSKNPYRLISYAVFGEAYYNLAPNLKVTAGLRYTVDKKRAPRIPSWLLATDTVGHPVAEIVEQEWREPTGRLAIDWKPDLGFTDETMIYASYAHGYKAGGANPPSVVYSTYNDPNDLDQIGLILSTSFPKTFDAEFIDAYELGIKNTLLDGRLTLNGNVFYYDYEGYQISQIINRSALNMNFDAIIWGAELEADWRPLENLRFGLKLGFQNTRVADGESAIDIMDRTAGNPDYIVIRPHPTIPSNCIVPVEWIEDNGLSVIFLSTCSQLYYRGITFAGLDPSTVPNNGEGIEKDLSGNELPNAPDMTATLTVDYTIPLQNDWLLTLHGDFYRQSEAWTRIFNMDPYDRLEPFEQVNLAAIFTNDDAGWTVMAYVKNAFDADNITGAFLNSDDTGLTTNVFLNEPRLYGVRVTKNWTGGGSPFGLGGYTPGQTFPLTVELGASVLRMDAPNEVFRPGWVDQFTSPGLPFPLGAQEEDLDWGDGREVKVTYRPAGRWTVAASARFGETNGHVEVLNKEQAPGGWQTYPDANPLKYFEGPSNYARTELDDREEHTIIDFTVGRDVGMGAFGDSVISAGIRYAQLDSASDMRLRGRPDYVIPEQYNILCGSSPGYCATVTHNDAEFSARRSFEGTGPALSWEASRALFQNDDWGEVSLDWSVGGAVLFGKQTAHVDGDLLVEDREFKYANDGPIEGAPGVVARAPAPGYPQSFTHDRNDDVTVPVLSGSLGLSYEVGRVKVGTGYRWERFYDAIDGGIEERKKFDRTIDGPYFKLSVGFGGG